MSDPKTTDHIDALIARKAAEITATGACVWAYKQQVGDMGEAERIEQLRAALQPLASWPLTPGQEAEPETCIAVKGLAGRITVGDVLRAREALSND